MILVVGASGILGLEICRRLRAKGVAVRGLVRPGSAKEDELRALGVEIAHGDLRVAPSIEAACRGATAVISTATAMGTKDKTQSMRAVDGEGQLRLLATAKAAGVGQFIFISASPNLTEAAPLIRYKRAMERAVRASGMTWTILQPTVFMEVWLSAMLGWDFVAGKAMSFGPGTTPLNWLSIEDVAEHAILALEDPRLANRDLPLAGPRALPVNEVVQIFERQSRRPYRTKRVPRAVLKLSPVVALFDEGAASGMSFGEQTSHGDVINSPLQREIGLPLTTIEQYAERVLRT